MERKSTTSPFQFNIVTWNCRGFNNSVPYLNFLLNLNNSIVVLQEHWLWPFELEKLQTVSEKIDYHAVSDPRLNETSELTRGCGGVAILWNKDLHVEKIPYPGNGKLCCTKVQLVDDTYLNIIGVYLPSYGYTEEYQTCLTDLEELLSGLPHSQPLVIVGDFNAHMANVGCNTVSNAQGLALTDLVKRNNLFVSPLDKGPGFTYCSGHTRTTVDYILVNQSASYLITDSEVLDNHPLNTSDHLAVHAAMEINPILSCKDTSETQRVNWKKAMSDQPCIQSYQRAVDVILRPLIGNTYDSIQ